MGRSAADTIEDLEFLNDSRVGATDAAARLAFTSAEAMESWLERHDRCDLWLAMKHRDPVGAHNYDAPKREKRRLMSVPTSTDDTFSRLLTNGEASTRARTRNRAKRARDLLHDLRVILNAEAQEDEQRTQASAEVERLTRELAEAKARLRGGSATTLDVDPSVTAAALREWARENDVECPAKGVVPRSVREAFEQAREDDAS